MKRRIVSLLLCLIMVAGIVPLHIFSASAATLYQTVKADVPVWTSASSKSTKAYTIAQSGTVVSVVSSTVNSSGNTWYKLSNGYWVFSGNVSKHSHKYSGGICTSSGCGYEWPYSVSSASGTYMVTNTEGAKIWSRPYSNNSSLYTRQAYGTTMKINGVTTNKEGNKWFRRTDGYWVFSGNVKRCYTVSYNANGGSGAPSAQVVVSGGTLTLSSVKPKRTGYVFGGWAKSSSALLASYSSGKSYSFSADTTLYAFWKKCSHSYKGGICSTCGYEYGLSPSAHSAAYLVTNANGAKIWSRPYSSNSTNVRVAGYNTSLSVTHKVTNQEGNVWYKLSDGNWVFSGNVKRRYTVSYNANGGSSRPANQFVASGVATKISSSKPTRVGYIFQGWGTSANTTKVTYKAGGSYKFTSSKTLYAVWKKCSHSTYKGGICTACKYEYKLTYTAHSATYVVTNSGGAKIWSRPYSNNSTNVRTAKCKAALTVTHKVKNKDGNLWYRLSDGNWVYSGNVKRKFAVSYNANGGKNAPSAQGVLNGVGVKLTTAKPTRAGYIFQGWGTSAKATKVTYKSGGTYKFTSSKTLYAVWKRCSTHTYSNTGYCAKCGAGLSYASISYSSPKLIQITNGTIPRVKPFSGVAKTSLALRKGDRIYAKAYSNVNGTVWYKLQNDSWVISKNAIVVNSTAAKNKTTVTNVDKTNTAAMNYLKSKVGTVTASGLIPGLMQTVTCTQSGAITVCKSMTPQGMTFGGGYMFVSAYCNCSSAHHSVVYVLNASTRKYITTLILDDYCHVGGLAVEGNYLWVCDSGGNKTEKKHLRPYSLTEIKQAVSNKMPHRTLKVSGAAQPVDTTPSYMCSANGYLYVGTHYEDATEDKDGYDTISTAVIYYYKPNGTKLEYAGHFYIRGIVQLQGISIKGDTMVLTSSLGRYNGNNSKVYVFKDPKFLFKTSGKYYYGSNARVFEFANMVEGCFIGTNYTYFICESAAKKYRYSLLTRPLDKYVAFSNKTLGIN